MAEIGTTSSTTWPVNRVVPSTTDARNSSKRQSKKQSKNNQPEDALEKQDENPKKKPPDSNLNFHIDEYA